MNVKNMPPSETKFHMMVMNKSQELESEIKNDPTKLQIVNENDETVMELMFRLQYIDPLLSLVKNQKYSFLCFIMTNRGHNISHFIHKYGLRKIKSFIQHYNKNTPKHLHFHPQSNHSVDGLNFLTNCITTNTPSLFDFCRTNFKIDCSREPHNLFTIAIECYQNDRDSQRYWLKYLQKHNVDDINRLPAIASEIVPLMSDATYKDRYIVKFLLENGADPNLKCHKQYPVFKMIRASYVDLIMRHIDLFDLTKLDNDLSNILLVYLNTLFEDTDTDDNNDAGLRTIEHDSEQYSENDGQNVQTFHIGFVNHLLDNIPKDVLFASNIKGENILTAFDFKANIEIFGESLLKHQSYINNHFKKSKLVKSLNKLSTDASFDSSVQVSNSKKRVQNKKQSKANEKTGQKTGQRICLTPQIKRYMNVHNVKLIKSEYKPFNLFNIEKSSGLPFDSRIYSSSSGLIEIANVFKGILTLPQMNIETIHDSMGFDNKCSQQIKDYLMIDKLTVDKKFRIIYSDDTCNYFPITKKERPPSTPYGCYYLSIVAQVQGSLKLHANLVIIDNVHKIIEHYDPYGCYYKTTDIWLRKRFAEIPCYKKYQYRMPTSEHVFAFQYMEIQNFPNRIFEPDGYCVAWCLWYLCQRLSNPNIYPCKLQRYLMIHLVNDSIDLNHMIRNFGSWVEDMKSSILKIDPIQYSKTEITESEFTKLGELLRQKWI